MSSPLQAVAIQALSYDEWHSYDRDHPAPTFFARPAWAMALHRATPELHPYPLRVTLSDGTRHLVPTVTARGRVKPFRHMLGMPLGTYTVMLDQTSGTPSSAERADAIMDAVLRHGDDVVLNAWPLAAQPQRGRTSAHSSAIIDLADGFDAAWARWDGRARRMAGQAERRGATCGIEGGQGAVNQYYDLLLESSRRWGRAEPMFSKSLLASAIQEAGPDGEIWMVRHNGTAIAGGVVFFGKSELFFWSAAMLMDYSEMRPSNLLNKRLLEAAVQRGVRWYNLGASEGLVGVERFKHSIGATEVQYFTYGYAAPRYRLWSSIRGFLKAQRSAG